MVVSLASFGISELFVLISAPQFRHLLVRPNDIVPQASQVFTLDLNELKLIKEIRNIKIGIKIISKTIFPKKLMKKLNPKSGTTIKNNIIYIVNFLFILNIGNIFLS